jgi:translation initiation factor RLI1
MNPGTVALIAALCTALGTILGVIITSVIQARIHRLNRESEERKHYKEIVVKAAIENWKQTIEVAKSTGGHVLPLESFIASVSKAADVMFDPTTNEINLAERLEKANTFVEIAESCALERTERYNKRKRQD